MAAGAGRRRSAMPATRAGPPAARCAGVRGRMELAARLPNGAAVYVDYAHTPDALERLLTALRPHSRRARLHVVFGAGGDRDRGKRPLMGAAAARLADRAIVTDDNPRSEDPAAIRAAVLAGCPGGTRDRRPRARDRRGAGRSRPGRRAGGGRQGPRAGPDDRRRGHPVRRRAARACGDLARAACAHDARCGPRTTCARRPAAAWPAPFAATGVSIDTRTLQPGDLFVALRGEPATATPSSPMRSARARPARWCTVTCPDCRRCAAAAGRRHAGRAASRLAAMPRPLHRPARRRHRQRRQDRRPRRCCGRSWPRSGRTHAAVASYNNHWGVPLTLARMPAGQRLLRRRDRHEPPRRDRPARPPRRARMSR